MKNNWIIILEFSFVWRLTKIQIFCTLQLNNNFSILLQNDELITSLLIIFVLVWLSLSPCLTLCGRSWLRKRQTSWRCHSPYKTTTFKGHQRKGEKTKAFSTFLFTFVTLGEFFQFLIESLLQQCTVNPASPFCLVCSWSFTGSLLRFYVEPYLPAKVRIFPHKFISRVRTADTYFVTGIWSNRWKRPDPESSLDPY